MCEKKYLKQGYCNPRIDECLIDILSELHSKGLKTLASCCGHGIYPKTIVVKDKNNRIFEYYSGIILGVRKRNCYYKKDEKNYYYIPECSTRNK